MCASPSPVLYSRISPTPGNDLLFYAVRAKRLDMYTHLQQRYGLKPDTVTVIMLAELKMKQALETVSKRATATH